ncbi:short-chain dehydrogenase [Tamlana nanhaiensis]|uniref:Short-chain dehydrogenase n=1 Tax=Neotamlana nanhaiensis TaxID=1382798 RepID=A0A0D7W0X4_9FLAO|nr:SDR family oxidoreductase [Tamlana nanhaiensis]KJD31502.1 short-chain dehydrogenase [Tamlana nanhaiensis]
MTDTKTVLITGGSRGLGRNMALKIANKGLNVIITYHTNKAAADNVVAEIIKTGVNAKAFQLDTSNTASFDAFFTDVEAYLKSINKTHFDYLVNNAGTGIYVPFTETTEAQFDDMMNIHFKGVYFLTQKALNLMNDNGGIINISSGLARFTFPNSSAYASMKGAIETFTKYVAKELGARKINANVVAPGAIATEFGNGENKTNETKRGLVANVTALGRVGEAEDIGGIVAFLCTEDAKWINGQRIEASGGCML